MAHGILAHDFLAVCLIFSDGDIRVPVAAIAKKAEQFQKSTKRRFGVTDEDFTAAIFMLTFHEGLLDNPDKDLERLLLSDIIPLILKYDEIYFNDEGEHWNCLNVYEDGQFDCWYPYAAGEKRLKQAFQKKARRLFSPGNMSTLNQLKVCSFLKENTSTDQLLFECSR